MKVQFTRKRGAGAMASLITETKIEELPDTTTVTDSEGAESEIPTPVPAGGTKVADNAVVKDWTPNRKVSGFGGGVVEGS